ncbi:MarR family winged helix-turn-helix transcriptional regulator [Companilactobacillus furfuricola]|uniref:MarR family winged helix-turn-helix transcriptional regulator n=1 Tax=Companilactobacillus furfuricola TaxID=1462575 RepID=UPI000F7A5D00|nr:MarR family transcriptional regulator [Companilactobacillus furfuricola]
MFKIDNFLAFITNQSGKIFSKKLEKDLRPYGVTRSQWIALYFIHETPKITQKELADKMSIKEPSIVRLIQRLESEGLLNRIQDENDKRNKQLQLTEKGDEKCLDLLPVAEDFKNHTVQGISEQDLETCIKVLNQMVENTKKD